jgi:pyruvate dehydrogenase E2 component (dihydrolipoamide acetyltransferase)
VEQADGCAAFASIVTVTLSADHRVVDGVLGAELLAAFKAAIENPISILV